MDIVGLPGDGGVNEGYAWAGPLLSVPSWVHFSNDYFAVLGIKGSAEDLRG